MLQNLFIVFHCISAVQLHIRLQGDFLLGNLLLPVLSFSNIHFGFPFRDLKISFSVVQIFTINKIRTQRISSPGSACNPLCGSELKFYEYLKRPMSWCFPCVQYFLRLLKPCVGDQNPVYFSKVKEHITSLIYPSKSMWSSNVSIDFSPNTLLQPSIMVVLVVFFILLKDFFDYTPQFFHFVSFIL
jgi:hypothetical protein